MNEMREEAMQKSGRRASEAKENHTQRPEAGTDLVRVVNSEKVGMMGGEGTMVGNDAGAPGRDYILRFLFGHSRSVDFTAGVRR